MKLPLGCGSTHVRGLGFLSLVLDTSSNFMNAGDRVVSPRDRSPAVLVVLAREDLEIARNVRELFQQ